ncbi:MAG TPA: SDR family oxidoreductase [Steroidobacteraceae bacterium]|nr:SDR family oxidoreductase [Steroidobacteraceae bacterium]
MSRIAVITGTTHGIGRVTSRELARAGRTVVMLCRDVPAAHTVRDEILRQLPHAAIHIVHCDLASLRSVRECAATVRRDYTPIGVLINNAGMVSVRHRMSADGFELTFATNHLGPFLLTALLLDSLAPDARIVNVASRIHFRGRFEPETITNPQARYSSQAAYAQSKLANVLHTFALARRLSGSRICVNCLHPGVVATNLLPRWLRLIKPLLSQVIDVERGARTSLYLALAAEVVGVSGHYFDQHQNQQPAAPLANDLQLQESLWKRSAEWVGMP